MSNNKNYDEEIKKIVEKENISFLKTLLKLKEKTNNNNKNKDNKNNNKKEIIENFQKNNFDNENLKKQNNFQNIFENNNNIKNINQIISPISKNENNFIQTPKQNIKNDSNVIKSTYKKISNKLINSEPLSSKNEIDSNIYIKDLLDGIGPNNNSSRPPSNIKIKSYNINTNNNNNNTNDMKKIIVGNNSISSIESIGSKNELQNGHILDIKLNNKEKSDFLSFNLINTPSKNSINIENNNINNNNNKIKDNNNNNNNNNIENNNNINKQKKKKITNINYFNTKKNIALIDKLIKESKKDEENLILNPIIETNINKKEKEKTIFDLYDIHSNQILKNDKKNINKSYNNNGRIYFKEKEKSYLNDAKIKINNFYKNNFFYQKNLNKGHSNSYENNKYYTNLNTKKDYIINKITNKNNNNKNYNSSKKNKNLSPFSQKIKININNIKNKSQNKNNNNNNINKIKTNYIKSIKLYFVKKNE